MKQISFFKVLHFISRGLGHSTRGAAPCLIRIHKNIFEFWHVILFKII